MVEFDNIHFACGAISTEVNLGKWVQYGDESFGGIPNLFWVFWNDFTTKIYGFLIHLECFFPGFGEVLNLEGHVLGHNDGFGIEVIGDGKSCFLVSLFLDVGQKREMGDFFQR